MKVTLEYYGHSCFKIANETNSVVLDPYANDSVPGLKLPEGISADRVYCSHNHADHNAKDLITETNIFEDVFNAEFVTVPHDDQDGALRGVSDISFLHVGQCTIAHLGDIGRLPTKEEYQKLRGANVLLVPVGGHYTIDAEQARKLIEESKCDLAILMHYRKGNIGYDVIADWDDVQEVFPQAKVLEESSITFEDTDIPKGIITLTPKQ